MNTKDALNLGDEMLTDAIDTIVELDWFGAENWYKPGASEMWSIKDIIAHLSAFESLLTDVLIYLENGATTPMLEQYIADPAHFDQTQIWERDEKSVGELLAEYEQAHDLNVNWLPHISEQKLSQPGLLSWFGAEQTAADFIVYAAYDHKRKHIDQIMSFIYDLAPHHEIVSHIPHTSMASANLRPLSGTWNRILSFAKLMS